VGRYSVFQFDGGYEKFLLEAQQGLINYAKVQFELNREIGDSGETIRSTLISMRKQTGHDDDRLNIRPPECFDALWGVFVGLWDGERMAMSELLAWCELKGVYPLDIELETLQLLARTAQHFNYTENKKRINK
jgi:hypothetical protein